MKTGRDLEPKITDAEFEVIEGPYERVYEDPELTATGWRKWLAELVGLAIFMSFIIAAIVVGKFGGEAFSSWWDGVAKAAGRLTGL